MNPRLPIGDFRDDLGQLGLGSFQLTLGRQQVGQVQHFRDVQASKHLGRGQHVDGFHTAICSGQHSCQFLAGGRVLGIRSHGPREQRVGSGRLVEPEHDPGESRERLRIGELLFHLGMEPQEQFFLIVDFGRAGSRIAEADPELPVLRVRMEKLSEFLQSPRIVLRVTEDVGDLVAKFVLIFEMFPFRELLVNRQRFLVIALPGQHVGQELAGLPILLRVTDVLLGVDSGCLQAAT